MALERTLYQWFAASVSKSGDQLALEAGPDRVTYQQLSDLVDQVAHQVLAVSRDVPRRVGVLAGRGVLAYAGYLAALRVGATVVPLSTTYPHTRIAKIATDGRLDVLLAEESFDLPVPVIPLGAGGSRESAPWPHQARVDDPAYILFTSGSTGTPKGVPVSHRNVSALLAHSVDTYEIGPGCRLAQTADLSFDLSVFPMWAAWATGATLVVLGARDLHTTAARFVAEHRITHWLSVPSVVSFAQRGKEFAPGCMPSLRWSLFCGEPLTVQQAEAWSAAAPNSKLANLYGPTEATVFCTGYHLPADTAHWPKTANGTLPIGSACPGVQIAIFDDDGKPAVDGELCVRGAQRFGGYLDPANNHGRFVEFDGERARDYRHEDPAPMPEEVWYRTGDRVVSRAGEVVHFGRLDQQVKIGGYRVELGEIEAVLRNQPGVSDAVVVLLTDEDGEADLLAACVGGDPDQLLAALRDLLPPYMVPVDVVLLPDFPHNANGKVDRAAVAAKLGDGLP